MRLPPTSDVVPLSPVRVYRLLFFGSVMIVSKKEVVGSRSFYGDMIFSEGEGLRGAD